MQVDNKMFEAALNRVSATQDGQIVLAMLCAECDFFKNKINYSDQSQSLAYAAVRGVWAKLRRFVPKKHLIEIEHNVEFVNSITKERAK